MPSSPAIRRGYTECRYGQMHFRTACPETPTAPTLILLHQNPSSSFEYEPLIAEMAKDRRVMAFDTPGYGMSDAPPSPPGIMGYAAAFSDAIDAMELPGPLDVYGFHTGTLLSAELAIARPDKIGRVAMTGIPFFDREALGERMEAASTVPAPTEDGEATMGLLRMFWDYAVSQRDPKVPLERAVLQFSDKSRMLHRYAWAYQGVWSYDYQRLALVQQPGLLFQPHEDILTQSKTAAALMPNMTVLEVPELDRDIFEIAVDQLGGALRKFFN